MSEEVPPLPESFRPSAREPTIRKEARGFCRELDLDRRYRELDRRPEFPRPEWKALAARHWLGPRVPRPFGGAGWTLHDEAVLVEEIAYGGGSVFAKLVLQPEFCSPLQHASPSLVDRWYRPLLEGRVLVGNQVTETSAGSDAGRMGLKAERVAGGFELSGEKTEIAFAQDAEAAIVYARSRPEEGSKGISAFLVAQDSPGLRRELHEDMGERWMRRGTVTYDRVRVPSENLIGQEGQGLRYLMEELTPERALLGLIYLAIARRSWEETRRHVGVRQAFGGPLATHQGVSFPLVRDHARIESARLWLWETLGRIERGDAGHAQAALAKTLANEVALDALDHAVQFHGGAGYSSRLPHEQRWRDVRSGSIAHGSSEVLLMIAAKALLARPAEAAPPETK